jgi:hypothetical protein
VCRSLVSGGRTGRLQAADGILQHNRRGVAGLGRGESRVGRIRLWGWVVLGSTTDEGVGGDSRWRRD